MSNLPAPPVSYSDAPPLQHPRNEVIVSAVLTSLYNQTTVTVMFNGSGLNGSCNFFVVLKVEPTEFDGNGKKIGLKDPIERVIIPKGRTGWMGDRDAQHLAKQLIDNTWDF